MRLLLVVLVLATGCATSPPDPEAVDRAVAMLLDRSRSEEAPIESEMLAIADELVATSTGADPHPIAILNSGADALTARIHAIRAARESVELQTFAWSPDDSGTLLFVELVRAAHRGVRVRVIVDQMGLPGSVRLVWSAIAHENLEVRMYNPVANKRTAGVRELVLHSLADFGLVNHRMHNKLIAVDGRLGIVGGRNIADRYFDMDPEFVFLDRDVLVLGPAVEDMVRSFDEYWEYEYAVPVRRLAEVGRELIEIAAGLDVAPPIRWDSRRLSWAEEHASARDIADVLPHSPLLEAERVQFFADRPSKRNEEGQRYDALTEEKRISESVQDYVVVQGNYLIFSRGSFRGLRRIMERRPDVEISYSTNSLASTGCFYCHAISRKQRLPMVHKYGMRIYELRPVPAEVRELCSRYDALVAEDKRLGEDHVPYEDFLIETPGYGPQFAIHAKSIVIDGRVGMIGSHNFDPRSELYNTECTVVFYGVEPVAALERELRRFMRNENSWTIGPKKRIPGWREFTAIGASISRALPVFDVWPFRYTSSFELKEGAEPVPMDDPRFYDSYRDVGQFPGVPFGLDRLKTRFFSAFGGFATRLL